jgi:hypothetical protein
MTMQRPELLEIGQKQPLASQIAKLEKAIEALRSN